MSQLTAPKGRVSNDDWRLSHYNVPLSGDAQVCLPYTMDHDWKWTQHRLSVTHNEDPFPQAAGIVVCRVLQGKLGKHVWRTKDFLIAADMDELSETTAVPWDYITRHVNRMQSILRKRQSQRSLLLPLEKKKIPRPECLIPVPAGCDNHMFTEPNWETTYALPVTDKKKKKNTPSGQFRQASEINWQGYLCPKVLVSGSDIWPLKYLPKRLFLFSLLTECLLLGINYGQKNSFGEILTQSYFLGLLLPWEKWTLWSYNRWTTTKILSKTDLKEKERESYGGKGN